MNKCHFLGKFSGDPEASIENGVSVIRFTLEIEEYRKGKDNEKIRSFTYLDFEAWDTAAQAIEKYTHDGCMMAVEAIARNDTDLENSENADDYVIFRVTSFKILH
jgi:single-stranded DNA-binding protein